MPVASDIPATSLLIDIGNTRIKWARFEGGRLGRQQAAIHSDWGAEDYVRRVIGADRSRIGAGEGTGTSVISRTRIRSRTGAMNRDGLSSRREGGSRTGTLAGTGVG